MPGTKKRHLRPAKQQLVPEDAFCGLVEMPLPSFAKSRSLFRQSSVKINCCFA